MIDVPALQPVNPLAGIAQAQQIRAQQQEAGLRTQQAQSQDLQIQQQQQQMQDQQAMNAAMREYDPSKPDQLVPLILKHGGSAQAAFTVQKSLLDRQQQHAEIAAKDAETGSKNIDTLQKLNEGAAGKLQAVADSPDDQVGKNLVQTAQQLAQTVGPDGKPLMDPSHVQMAMQLAQSGDPNVIRQGIAVAKKFYLTDSALAKDVTEQSEQNKNNAQGRDADANAKLAAAKAAFYAKTGLAPGVSPDEAGLADYLQKNPGKGPADFLRAKAGWAPAARFAIETNGAGGAGNGANPPAGGGQTDWGKVARGFGLTPGALDQSAEKYFQTGQLPTAGRGISGVGLQRAIQNRAAELHPDAQLAANSAEYKANSSSLAQLQRQRDSIGAFETTAGKNLDIFLNTAKDVIDTGNPMMNKPLRAVSAAMGGTSFPAYQAARQIAVNEVAKITSNPSLAGALSDSARQEVAHFNPDNATLAQTYKIVNILRQDMANRPAALDEQIADIKKRLGASGNSPRASAPQSGGFSWGTLPRVK